MPSFNQTIRPYVSAELTEAWCALRRGERASSFLHLERAYVLGQSSTLHHVRVHLSMLAWALRTRVPREVAAASCSASSVRRRDRRSIWCPPATPPAPT
ncbi:MAG: DUF3703 domain-containing protein [Pseudomonadota bacterium]